MKEKLKKVVNGKEQFKNGKCKNCGADAVRTIDGNRKIIKCSECGAKPQRGDDGR